MKHFYPLNYYITQDDNILGQLIHGARYLDIRPAYYEDREQKWYVNHDFVIQQPLSVVMDQVIQFVNETNEIVIFGLKEFPVGFKNNPYRHNQLVEFMEKYFDDFIVRPNGFTYWSLTLNEILSHSKGRIILAYDKEVQYANDDTYYETDCGYKQYLLPTPQYLKHTCI
uniref:Phosphatidylinositol-specific phospholipase C X domain-containing protein n=1 Tax=Megaselia scalaris TaxID=36166 RepID=T1H2W1_MEGSC